MSVSIHPGSDGLWYSRFKGGTYGPFDSKAEAFTWAEKRRMRGETVRVRGMVASPEKPLPPEKHPNTVVIKDLIGDTDFTVLSLDGLDLHMALHPLSTVSLGKLLDYAADNDVSSEAIGIVKLYHTKQTKKIKALIDGIEAKKVKAAEKKRETINKKNRRQYASKRPQGRVVVTDLIGKHAEHEGETWHVVKREHLGKRAMVRLEHQDGRFTHVGTRKKLVESTANEG